MITIKILKTAVALTAALTVSGCGALKSGTRDPSVGSPSAGPNARDAAQETSSIWDMFAAKNTENNVLVNKYLWTAAIEVLDFLPIQTIDPFTGVIVTGYGTPPNGSSAYRATILIDDPALDARSLTVALQTRGGAASAATSRAIEDAILSRARQMRISDNKF
jgi:hypothetical protein|tara:strand:- start:812 stop:1300 length:489 start_codon:yes stop_codon:yes gene_type:complete